MFSVCFVTTPSMEVAQRIAGELVKSKLIACANILPGATSVYEWEGKVCTDAEHLMIMKTQSCHIGAIIENVKALHPYDCPEVISTPMGQGSPEYLKWLQENTTLSKAAGSAGNAAAAAEAKSEEKKKE